MPNPRALLQHRPSRGFALIMVLVFLLLLTILGLATMNTTLLQEKMAGNTKDKEAAFEAAETALLAAENWVLAQLTKPLFPDVNKGLYIPSTNGTRNWDQVDWSGTANLVVYPSNPYQTVSGGLAKVPEQPKYIVEDMGEVKGSGTSLVMESSYKGKGSTVVRITAHGTGSSGRGVARVQSTYMRDF